MSYLLFLSREEKSRGKKRREEKRKEEKRREEKAIRGEERRVKREE